MKKVDPDAERLVKSLLAEGRPYAEVADIAGVSLASVSRISNRSGKAKEHRMLRRKRKLEVASVATRCPTCRGMVYLINGRCHGCFVAGRLKTKP